MQVIIPNTTGTLMVSGVYKHDGTCTKLMRKIICREYLMINHSKS